MNSKFGVAFEHAIKVGFHILFAIFAVGVVVTLEKHSAQYAAFLMQYGIPVGVTNMVVAGVLKYLNTHYPDVTIDSLPDEQK